ncbi:unnamed protein product, partial [Rotaria magnacalcarata]
MIARTMPNVVFDDAVNRANVNRATMLVGCGACSIMCISLTLFVFLFGWSMAGWAWVLEAWHRVQFQHEANNDYCHPLVYRFTVKSMSQNNKLSKKENCDNTRVLTACNDINTKLAQLCNNYNLIENKHE